MKRKHLITLTVFMALFCLASYGQGKSSDQKPKKLKTSFGLKAGLNLATINNGQSSINYSPGMKTDFHFGAVVNMHFGSRNEGSPVGTGYFGLQPELLYSRQGFMASGKAINFDYISLPILAKVYITRRFGVEVGPYFSYMLNGSPGSITIDGAQIAVSGLKGGMDAGASLGIGYESKIGLTLGARYNYGMSDVAKNLQWKNNVIAISIGWLF